VLISSSSGKPVVRLSSACPRQEELDLTSAVSIVAPTHPDAAPTHLNAAPTHRHLCDDLFVIWTIYHFEFGDHCDLDCVISPPNNNLLCMYYSRKKLAAKILNNIQGIPYQFFQNAILLLARYNLYSISRRAMLF
jgi:hypothetical protein